MSQKKLFWAMLNSAKLYSYKDGTKAVFVNDEKVQIEYEQYEDMRRVLKIFWENLGMCGLLLRKGAILTDWHNKDRRGKYQEVSPELYKKYKSGLIDIFMRTCVPVPNSKQFYDGKYMLIIRDEIMEITDLWIDERQAQCSK